MCLVQDRDAIVEMAESSNALPIARIECHFTHNGFFFKTPNYILDNAKKIEKIPCRIVQGRYDVICPPVSAWELHRSLPNSDLRLVATGAHSPMEPAMAAELIQATEDFKIKS